MSEQRRGKVQMAAPVVDADKGEEGTGSGTCIGTGTGTGTLRSTVYCTMYR